MSHIVVVVFLPLLVSGFVIGLCSPLSPVVHRAKKKMSHFVVVVFLLLMARGSEVGLRTPLSPSVH